MLCLQGTSPRDEAEVEYDWWALWSISLYRVKTFHHLLSFYRARDTVPLVHLIVHLFDLESVVLSSAYMILYKKSFKLKKTAAYVFCLPLLEVKVFKKTADLMSCRHKLRNTPCCCSPLYCYDNSALSHGKPSLLSHTQLCWLIRCIITTEPEQESQP